MPSGNYLPDFKVIDLLSFNPWEWFEVKGTHPTVGEIQLLKELCAETGTWGTFLGGIPDPVDDVEPAVVQRHRGCPSCRCETRSYGSFFRLSYMTPVCPKCVDHDPTTHHVNPDLRQFVGPFEPMDLRRAFSAARSARFEHGHSGAS